MSLFLRSPLPHFARLLAATVLLPLLVVALGFWEAQRGGADFADVDAEHVRLKRIVEALEARAPRDGSMDFRLQFRRDGQTYVGPLALEQARAARDEVATVATLLRWRETLPPIVIGAAGLAAAVSVLVLAAGAVLGQLGRSSREVLVRGFAAVRRVLPALLALQVILGAAAFTSAVLFEAAALAQPGVGSGEIKLLLLAIAAVLASLWGAGTALFGLRRALAAFEPDPLVIHGRPVSPEEAPGLWRLVDALAERLGALKPDAVVVGLTEGFFVSAGPKRLEPSGERLSGRTLYVPLPYLPLLRPDELLSILGHELAHFAGGDTAYSLRFLPIYAGVGRSLGAVAAAEGAGLGVLGPAMQLGLFVMDRFHLAVRHWSRMREFAADTTGAEPTSPEAAARALLRSGPVGTRIAETLRAAAEHPGGVPDDLVAAVLAHARAGGLGDAITRLDAEQAHPTDTHPPTRERIARLRVDLTPDLLAAAAALPAGDADSGVLAACFADPTGVCRTATADFLAAARQRDAAFHAHLQATAAAVEGEERALCENIRAGVILFATVASIVGFAGLALLGLGMPGLSAGEARVFGAVLLGLGLLLGSLAAFRHRQGERPYLILRPDVLTVPGLDRAIAWDDVADLDMAWNRTGMSTRLLLRPGAPFPERGAGPCWAKLDAARRIVTIAAGLPRRMKPADFAGLVGRYRDAAQARRLLAERHPLPVLPSASRPIQAP